MKYKGKEYQVKDLGCKALKEICFIPFSGNGINICRKYELGKCPSNEEIMRLRKEVRKKNIRKYHSVHKFYC